MAVQVQGKIFHVYKFSGALTILEALHQYFDFGTRYISVTVCVKLFLITSKSQYGLVSTAECVYQYVSFLQNTINQPVCYSG